MKCATHNQEATGVCPYCGRGSCGACERVASSSRTACSAACAEALTQTERAVQLILRKHLKSTRLTSYFLCVSGFAFIAVAILGYLKDPRIYIAHLLAAVFGVIVGATGVAFHRSSASSDQQPNQALPPKVGSSDV